MFRPLVLSLVAGLALLSQPAMAQHSDVEFEYDNGQIVVYGGEPSSLDASRLFEGECPTSGLSQNFSSDPGFASEVAEGLGVNPGDDIFLNFVLSPSLGGALQYHDGSGFAATTANTLVEGNAPGATDLTITSGGFSGDNPVFLQTADSAGDIHSHVDFTLSAGAAQGAYGLLVELETSAPGISNSDPFWFVFNHGLDEITFEDVVVPAFQGGAAIPEPAFPILLGIGSIGLGLRRRRHS